MAHQTTPRRIYLASSWRNPNQPAVLAALRAAGHEVYDFRNPAPGKNGFSWRDCGGIAAQEGPGASAKTIPSYMEAIRSERAAEGFAFDKVALDWCDTCVLALPCGRSAHLELGYATGQGKETYVLLHEDKFEPELMYLLNTAICTDVQEVIDQIANRNHLETTVNATPTTDTIRIANLPALRAPLAGGEFAGISTQKDGTHVAVIRLPGRGEDLDHSGAKAYAAERGGKLPSKAEAALITTNLEVEAGWCWIDEEYNASCAWYFLSYGNALGHPMSAEGGALAVRLIPITA